jgi:hypothetical protein
MDKKLKITYILTGIALIGQIYFYWKYADYFIVSILIVLLLLSIIGSIRARLVLIGFLLCHCIISLNTAFFIFSKADILSSSLNYTIIKAIIVTTLILLVVTILLFKSIDIKEISSQFSERAPLKLTAALFLIMISWSFAVVVVHPILDYKEVLRSIQNGRINTSYLINALFFLLLNTFIVFSIYKKRAIGIVLAPIILIMTIAMRIEVLFENYRQFRYEGIFNIFKDFFDASHIRFFDFFMHYVIFPLLAIPLFLFFIFYLKEDTLGIVTAKLKKIRGVKNENG